MNSSNSKIHRGPVLEPSARGFDTGGATFCCAFVDLDDPHTIYLYYTGFKDARSSHAAVGLAVLSDGEHFRKLTGQNPLVDGRKDEFNSRQSVTPAVIRVGNYFYMFFAGSRKSSLRLPGRSCIGVAYSDDPRGPWKVVGKIAEPEAHWEGWSIDLGPSVVDLGRGRALVYYSNVFNALPVKLSFPFFPKYIRRRVGILSVTIRSPTSIVARKYSGNPLMHLNGPKGAPSESLFCPGYLPYKGKHILLPSMSTYSTGFPFNQYIGIVSDNTPFFQSSSAVSVLIDGPSEKKEILGADSEIALDTPSPILWDDKLYLYYSVMDRNDGIWKTALSVMDSFFRYEI